MLPAAAAAAAASLTIEINNAPADERTEQTYERTRDERERASERVETVNSKTFEQLESEFQLSAPHNRTARKIFLN